MIRPEFPAGRHPIGGVFASQIFCERGSRSKTDDVMKRGSCSKLLIRRRVEKTIYHVKSHPTTGRVVGNGWRKIEGGERDYGLEGELMSKKSYLHNE